MDTVILRSLSALSPARRRARRIQWEIHGWPDRASRWILRDAGRSHQAQLSQLLSPGRAVAVQRHQVGRRLMNINASLSSPTPHHARPVRDHGFARAFLDGMKATPKRVPCKYFYDALGSTLFEQICELPEYYQTRTELALLAASARDMAEVMGANVELIEFGAGALTKVRLLLDALQSPL